MAVNLSVYDILQGPVVTDKARDLYEAGRTLVIRVHPQANKPQIKYALEKLFNVKVQDVRTVIRKGKAKLNRKSRTVSIGKKRKHAYISLKAGYSLDLATQGNVQDSAPAQQGEE
jgi:large subunit ribosomal protein L23